MRSKGFALIGILISLVILGIMMMVIYTTVLRQSPLLTPGSSPGTYLDKAREAQQKLEEKQIEEMQGLK